MLNKNRKGVSEVVANVLIVLLVIVGIAVLWSVVKPTIDKSAKGINSDCFTVSVEAVSCSIVGANQPSVIIKRNPGSGAFENVDLLFEDASGNTQRYTPTGTNMISNTGLTELETMSVLGINGITTSGQTKAVNVNVVVTSNGQLCQITTQPVNCVYSSIGTG